MKTTLRHSLTVHDVVPIYPVTSTDCCTCKGVKLDAVAQVAPSSERPAPTRASVRGVSVRRGSKAVANDGTKLRGVDIRMAAAFALKEIVTETKRAPALGEFAKHTGIS